jgi:hypothetical protein
MDHDSNDSGDENGYGHHPWRRDRYVIARTRRALRTATATQLRAAVAAGLTYAEALIDAAERQDGAEWQFQRAEGASRIAETIGRLLDV